MGRHFRDSAITNQRAYCMGKIQIQDTVHTNPITNRDNHSGHVISQYRRNKLVIAIEIDFKSMNNNHTKNAQHCKRVYGVTRAKWEHNLQNALYVINNKLH